MNKIFENKLGLKQNDQIRTIYTEKRKIILPRVFGFCGGVVGALRILEKTIKANQRVSLSPEINSNKRIPSIYLLGEIIHNSTVNQTITATDVIIIPEAEIRTIFDHAKEDDYIVIPAFGIPLDLERAIRKQYKNIVDTTCKNVKSVWDFISLESKKGATILLYGKPGHPEVRASISRAESGNCIIILPNLAAVKIFSESIDNCDLDNLKKLRKEVASFRAISCYDGQRLNPKRFALASQTTMLYDEALEAEKIIRKSIEKRGSKLFTCNTICQATYLRQQAALEICKQAPNLTLVVGGYESSNTQHLYKLAKKYSPAYYLRDAQSISNLNITYFNPREDKELQMPTEQMLKNVSVIAILAGASCPFTVINKIIKKLRSI